MSKIWSNLHTWQRMIKDFWCLQVFDYLLIAIKKVSLYLMFSPWYVPNILAKFLPENQVPWHAKGKLLKEMWFGFYYFLICSAGTQSFEIVVISWKRFRFLINVFYFHLKHTTCSNSSHESKLINWYMSLELIMFQCLHRLCSKIVYARKQTQYDHNPWNLDNQTEDASGTSHSLIIQEFCV